jgi:hypothetical protein
VALTEVTDEDLESIISRIADAKGVIFDFRGYPKFHPKFFGHFTDEKMLSPRWEYLEIFRPNHEGVSFKTAQWSIEPIAPRIRSKNVFLIEHRVASAAETYLSFVSHYKLGTLIGKQTAGTNGNTNGASLPGGFYMTWTGMKVLKQDGSQHHGIGILPDIPVSRTLKGVAEGRDEVLEEGIKVVTRLTEQTGQQDGSAHTQATSAVNPQH